MKLRLILAAFLTAFFTLAIAQDPVTITYWTDPALAAPVHHPEFTSLAEFETWQAEQFMAMYPHVTVVVEGLAWEDLSVKVPTAIAAGNPPDILKDYLGRTSTYGHAGVTVDLYEHLPAEEVADLLPGLVDLYTIDGRLHAMPTYFWDHQMIVNKALFDEAGLGHLIPVDDRDWTQEEFIDALRQIKAADVGVEFPFALQVANQQGDYNFNAFVWGAGGEIWNADCTTGYSMPETLAGLEFANQLYQEGLINPDATTASLTAEVELFVAGRAAVMGGGLGSFNNTLPNALPEGGPTIPWEPILVTYPHVEGEVNGFPAGPSGFAVFDKGRSDYEMEWVTNFLLFLNSTESEIDYVQGNSQYPARISAGAPLADDPNYVRTVELIEARGTENLGLACPGFGEIRLAQPPQIQAMFLGQMTPAETAEALARNAQEILDNQ